MRPILAVALACIVACGASKPSRPTSTDRRDAKAEISIAIVDGDRVDPGTGTIAGTITSIDGERMVEVSTVATSPSITGENVALTDHDGAFVHATLPPGKYTMTYFYARSTFVHDVEVVAGKVTRITITKWHPGPVGELL
jgi:hypothetical protein